VIARPCPKGVSAEGESLAGQTQQVPLILTIRRVSPLDTSDHLRAGSC
jgi:hypothetical protein